MILKSWAKKHKSDYFANEYYRTSKSLVEPVACIEHSTFNASSKNCLEEKELKNSFQVWIAEVKTRQLKLPYSKNVRILLNWEPYGIFDSLTEAIMTTDLTLFEKGFELETPFFLPSQGVHNE